MRMIDAIPIRVRTPLTTALAAFLFRGDDVYKPIGVMSGGERARLLLLKLMLAGDNLLLLDEPTNHLDIASREALEEALVDYDGTILAVSHDRYFINRMASRVVQFTRDGLQAAGNNYDAYTAAREQAAAAQPTVEKKSPKENDYKLRKERESTIRRLQTAVRRAEERVGELEEEIDSVNAQLNDPAVAADYARLTELTERLTECNRLLEETMTQWEQSQQQLDALTAE
jgi:ATP-binding cassette subfamily F protein 3